MFKTISSTMPKILTKKEKNLRGNFIDNFQNLISDLIFGSNCCECMIKSTHDTD